MGVGGKGVAIAAGDFDFDADVAAFGAEITDVADADAAEIDGIPDLEPVDMPVGGGPDVGAGPGDDEGEEEGEEGEHQGDPRPFLWLCGGWVGQRDILLHDLVEHDWLVFCCRGVVGNKERGLVFGWVTPHDHRG